MLCCCGQEASDNVLMSRSSVTDLIQRLCDLPYVMADWQCSTAVIKCLLSVINNSYFSRPYSDAVGSFSSWAMVGLLLCHHHCSFFV